MPDNRPQGRKTKVSGQSTGAYRRGEGQNTGPVGSAGSNPNRPGRPSGQGMSRATKAGGGGLLIIIIAVIYFLLSGKLDLGGLTGGDTGTSGISSGYSDVSSNPYANLIGDSTSSGSAQDVNTSTVDTSVAAGARDKYTQILGNQRDEVTIMVYMCGTDLESKSGMATKDLTEMTRATIGPNVHVVVYTGGCTRWNNSVVSNSQNQIYEVQSGGLKRVVDNDGTGAMTDPNTLARFIQWSAKNYPANRYMLIFWDHGGGSVSGYGYDEKNKRSGSMTLDGIDRALKSGGVQFDFVGFDACLMATVETGMMLEPYADYMIASEETEPGIGWYYTDWLTKLSNNTSMPTVDIGKNIVDDFVSACARQCPGQSATLSVVDIAELSATVPEAMRGFSNSVTSLIQNNGYQQVSSARNGAREFARSNAIDQVDLVHFAKNLDTPESRALAECLLGAVKYNRTSSNMSNSYGLSIYFPYRKTSNVDKAVQTYQAIGMDSSYSQCIREFASMEVSGQVVSGGSNNPYASLLGGGYSGASSNSFDLTSLLGDYLGGGDFGSIPGLSSGNTGFLFGRSMSTEDTADYIAANHFDPSYLTWTQNADGEYVIAMPEEQWAMVEGLALNVFLDDGEGYIDLGLDVVFQWDEDNNLLAPQERSWVAINDHPVAYYHEYTVEDGTYGYVPAMLNGERVELLLRFDAESGEGELIGIRTVYEDEEIQELPKTQTELGEEVDLENTSDADSETRVRLLQPGDVLDFLCDYYRYDGSYENSYFLGEQLVIGQDGVKIENVPLLESDRPVYTFRFTDLYQQHYWTESLRG
jgi:hypothetical protein